ncbi:MAG: phosphoglycerate mutase, partial [Sellimonas sp.]|nr:phosphoglycerate mutase [Sellimonas sp.]
HVEAPDEMGHQGSVEKKVRAIEFLDQRLIRIVREAMDASGEPYRLLILPDHPTPIAARTHTADPVPYLLYDRKRPENGAESYCERTAVQSGRWEKNGYHLIEHLFEY